MSLLNIQVKIHTYIYVFNPFAPVDFAEKRVLKLVEWFSGHCRATYHKPVYR